MAYQESSYGPRSTYAGPTTNNTPHFPQSHHQQLHPHYYPNPNPSLNLNPSYTPPHSNQSSFNQPNATSTSPPIPQYPHSQPSDPQTYQAQRLPYPSNQNHHAGPPLMQPPMSLPDDHFKKPFLPQQQYINHGQSPANFIDHQRQKSSSAVSDLALAQAQAYAGAPTAHKRLHSSGSSYPPTSTMTVTAAPANPSSTQSTPTSEVPSQPADPALQANGLSSLDQQRVDALLQVNNLLIQEVTILQKVGLGLKPSPQSPQQTAAPNSISPQATPAPATSAGDSTSSTPSQNNSAAKTNPPVTTPTTTTPTTATAPQQQSLNTKKYVEFMTRIKTNIMFLVSISDQAKDKPRMPYPSHLETPPLWLNPGNEEGDKQLDSLREEYAKLRELWPDWKPEIRKPQVGGGGGGGAQQAQQQQMRAATSAAAAAAADATVTASNATAVMKGI